MDHRTLREMWHAQPFRPFRMRLNDGREYTVPHPDYLSVGPLGRHVVHYDSAREDAMTVLEPLLIASVEYIQTATPPPASGNGDAGTAGS